MMMMMTTVMCAMRLMILKSWCWPFAGGRPCRCRSHCYNCAVARCRCCACWPSCNCWWSWFFFCSVAPTGVSSLWTIGVSSSSSHADVCDSASPTLCECDVVVVFAEVEFASLTVSESDVANISCWCLSSCCCCCCFLVTVVVLPVEMLDDNEDVDKKLIYVQLDVFSDCSWCPSWCQCQCWWWSWRSRNWRLSWWYCAACSERDCQWCCGELEDDVEADGLRCVPFPLSTSMLWTCCGNETGWWSQCGGRDRANTRERGGVAEGLDDIGLDVVVAITKNK